MSAGGARRSSEGAGHAGRHEVVDGPTPREWAVGADLWKRRSYAWVEPETVIAYCETHRLSPLSLREALKNVAP